MRMGALARRPPRNDHVDRRPLERGAALDAPRPQQTSEDPRPRRSPAAPLWASAGRRRHRPAVPHVFFPDHAAALIGWPPGTPFQLKVGFHDGAWGLLGFLSIWIDGSFWLATGLGSSFFMLGATYGHLHQTLS